MNKAGNVFILIIGLFLLVGAFRQPIIDGVKGWRTSDTTQSQSVLVAADNTTITLSYDLYQAELAEIIDITSNVTGSPAAYGYTESTRSLAINGLGAGQQTLVVEYYAETDDTVMQVIGPFLLFFIFFGIAGLMIWGATHSKR